MGAITMAALIITLEMTHEVRDCHVVMAVQGVCLGHANMVKMRHPDETLLMQDCMFFF